MISKLLDIIYPPKCVLCGILLDKNKIGDIQNYACKNCKKKLQYYRRDFRIISSKNQFFDEAFFVFKYTNIIRKLILDFKFQNKKYLYRFFSFEMTQTIQKFCTEKFNEIDYVIAVPISYKRFLERGYNQSKLIASSISKSLNIPYASFCLFKIKHNKRQSELNTSERFFNTQGVYKVFSKEKIHGKKLLLIDDIYTTGSTINECCKVLRQAGAKYILVVTIARAF